MWLGVASALLPSQFARAATFDAHSEWLSAVDAPVVVRTSGAHAPAAEGTSWFMGAVVPEKKVAKAIWTTTALGVYEIYVNGRRIGNDVLKPGYTTLHKTRLSFAYDVTSDFACAAGATNVLAAEVSSGWWRDRIVCYGRKSAFRAVLELTYADGSIQRFGTNCRTWKASGKAGPVRSAGIFEGEVYDARVAMPAWGDSAFATPEPNTEFKGEIRPTDGGEICWREDLAMPPIEAYRWKGVTDEDLRDAKKPVFGKVVKTWMASHPKGTLEVLPGETLVIDFGQNCAAVPSFVFSAAAGTTLVCLPAEMLNDANGERSRGNDGPAGSVYRENLRITSMMRAVYAFAGRGEESYRPRFTFFGYRYLSLTATAPVRISSLLSVPVTSIAAASERGSITTGRRDVNRLIRNVYWGQLSNYLGVPTDCPQRDERRGWTADTQVFAEAGTFNADTSAFLRKWMRDMCDSSAADGRFPEAAPGWLSPNYRVGWLDAGVIVPWTAWKQFGDTRIVRENFAAMEKWMAYLDKKGYHNQPGDYQYADWLSFENYEAWLWRDRHGSKHLKDVPKEMLRYWDLLCGCYWVYDAKLMREMSVGIGKADAAARYAQVEKRIRESVRAEFLDEDGRLPAFLRPMQTPYVMALKAGLFRNERERRAGAAALVANIRANGNRLATGFLGTSFILDVLTDAGYPDVAYDLLLQHENPSWLHSVDQGATTIWERWDGYEKSRGFGPVNMNSYNHYAYGAVLAWIYKTAAGIAADTSAPGFKHILMMPKVDRRLGSLSARYKTPDGGLITSDWRYEGDRWVWNFTIPAGSTAHVVSPYGTVARDYPAGTWRIDERFESARPK